MKHTAAALILALFAIRSLRADVTIVQNVEGIGEITTMTIKIKGEKARIEANPQVTTIIDSRTGEMLNLMNGQKKFMRLSGNKTKAIAALAGKGDDKSTPAEKAKLVPTGRKETINGFEAAEYTCESPSFKATYWISTSYPDAAAIVKQLQAMTPAAWSGVGQGMPDYRDFSGLPLRSVMSMKGRQVTSTISSVKQDPLPESDFVAPKDFEEMKMPDLQSLLGGKTEAPKAAATPKK